MSEFKLSDTIEVSIETAKEIINKFFSGVPKVKEFLYNIGNAAKRYKCIRTGSPYRRIRFFDVPDFNDHARLGEIQRAGQNTPIQGSNADMTKLAMILVYDYIRVNNLKNKIKLILTIHDEIQTECLEDISSEWALKMSELMKDAAKVILKKVPMSVDCTINEWWKK
jgi:DNA polymerase-1